MKAVGQRVSWLVTDSITQLVKELVYPLDWSVCHFVSQCVIQSLVSQSGVK